MKTLLKLSFSALILTVLMSSCGTTYKCMEGPEDREDEVPSETGFKNETPVEDVKEKWIPAAERTTNVNIETTTGLASDNTNENTNIEEEKEGSASDNIDNSRKREGKFGAKKKGKFKKIINRLKDAKKNKKRGVDGMTVLLVILAILLPPLAVGIYEGITGRFWLVLVLWLIAWAGLGWWLGWHIAGLCSLVAVILALLIVLGVW